MRPYYTDGVKEKLNKLTPANRRKVINHARAEGVELAHPLDVQGNCFAVMPRHLIECGFTGPRQSEKKARTEAFIDHMVEFEGQRGYITRRTIRQRMANFDGPTRAAWKHFQAGWKAYAG